jgi:hypothetical protein
MGAAADSAGKLPDNPGFDGTESCPASVRRGPRFGDVVKDPFDLGSREIGGDGQPGFLRKRSWPPALARALQISSVRVHCQTMALYKGWPVFLSQTTAVSRWLVIPMPAISLPATPAFPMAPLMTRRCFPKSPADRAPPNPVWEISVHAPFDPPRQFVLGGRKE